jgi:hypothetical protein
MQSWEVGLHARCHCVFQTQSLPTIDLTTGSPEALHGSACQYGTEPWPQKATQTKTRQTNSTLRDPQIYRTCRIQDLGAPATLGKVYGCAAVSSKETPCAKPSRGVGRCRVWGQGWGWCLCVTQGPVGTSREKLLSYNLKFVTAVSRRECGHGANWPGPPVYRELKENHSPYPQWKLLPSAPDVIMEIWIKNCTLWSLNV